MKRCPFTLSGALRSLWLVPLLSVAMSAEKADRQLISAVEQHDNARIAALLKGGTDVNARQPDGATALHWAAQSDDLQVVDTLIRAGASVNVANEYGVTPLSLAATNGSTPVAARLLKAGAQVNAALPSGETPLMTASRVGKLELVKLLVGHGADVNARESIKGQTALMWSISEDHLDVARLLIEAGADVNPGSKAGFTPLLFAARQGSLDTVKMLLERKAPIDGAATDGSTPLLTAVVRGHTDLALYLLDHGANANADGAGFTALHWASGKWESETTHDYPDAIGEWEALGGVKHGKIKLIQSLLAHGADINARMKKSPPRFGHHMFAQIRVNGGTPFWLAALSADLDVMHLLVANGADPEMKSEEGTTALMVAAGVGRVAGDSLIPETDSIAATKLCLELGNDINAQNNTGYAALHGTAFYGLDNVAKVLVEHGADMEIKNKKGETPLKIAEGTINQYMLISHPSTAEVLRGLAAARGPAK